MRPRNWCRAVKYAAGTATTRTRTVEVAATISDVFSQLRKRSSDRMVPKVSHCQVRGNSVGGVASTSPLGRSASSSITR